MQSLPQTGAQPAPPVSHRPPAAVEVESLVRSFGARRAIDGVSFSLQAGESLAVFGPNGAGKTTLLRLLAGLLRPTAGHVRIGGTLTTAGDAARANAGVVSHGSMLYSALTALENVEFAARMYGVRDARAAARASLERIGVLDRADTPVRALSRGLQQRVSIARALVHAPAVLLLDEPFSGLDELGSQRLAELLRKLRDAGAAMVVTTHNIAEGLSLSSHCAMMFSGVFARTDASGAQDTRAYAALYHSMAAHGV